MGLNIILKDNGFILRLTVDIGASESINQIAIGIETTDESFAKNAGAERNRRRDEKLLATEEVTYLRLELLWTISNSKENDLAKKIAEAKKNLSPSATQSPVSRNQPVENIQSDLETKTGTRPIGKADWMNSEGNLKQIKQMRNQ